jgi:putative spermidine/putrescine transport system substrate-binding protein
MTKKVKVNKSRRLELSRRQVVKLTGAAAVAAALPTILTPRKAMAAIKITVRDPGGPYVDAFSEAYYKPFNEMMKGEVVVTGVAGKHEPTAQIKSMVDTGSYTWDMAHLSISAHNLLRDAGYLTKLEIEDNPDVQEIPGHFRTPYLLGVDVYTTILAYRSDVYPKKGPEPTGGWKDLWNVSGIPGRRAMRKHAFDTIEQALMADGVAPADVYPCDFERALRSLDKIKDHIDIWWTGGAQTSQLLKTGEVDICPTWNGRSQAAIDAGGPIKVSWNQSLWTFEGMCVLRDGPNVDACRKFAAFCANAKRQAVHTKWLAYGPTNPGAYNHIPDARAAVLPTAPQNFEISTPVDSVFWGKEKDKGMEMFNEWLLS